jgi:hypothetical protein
MHRRGTREIAISRIPTGPSGRPEPGLSAPALCIPTGGETDAAWSLLRELISTERMLADATDPDDPEPSVPRDSVLAASAFDAAFGSEVGDVVRATRAYARINRPLIPFGRELGEIVGRAAATAISGAQPPDAALRAAQATIDGLNWSGERPWNLGTAG